MKNEKKIFLLFLYQDHLNIKNENENLLNFKFYSKCLTHVNHHISELILCYFHCKILKKNNNLNKF